MPFRRLLLIALLCGLISFAATTTVNMATQTMGLLAVANGGTNSSTANAQTLFGNCTSSTGIAPGYCVPTIAAVNGLPKGSQLHWCYEADNVSAFSGNGGCPVAPSFSGNGSVSHNAATATDPAYLALTAGTSANSSGQLPSVSSMKEWVFDSSELFYAYARLTNMVATTADNARVYLCAGSDTGIGTLLGSDNPAGNYACFAYSSARDSGSWQCITKDGATQNVVSASTTVDTSWHLFKIYRDGSNYKFDIDGSNKCSTGTHIPTSGTAFFEAHGIVRTAASAAASSLEIAWLFRRATI